MSRDPNGLRIESPIYMQCEFFKEKKSGEPFMLLGQLFVKIGDTTAVKVEAWYDFDEETDTLRESNL